VKIGSPKTRFSREVLNDGAVALRGGVLRLKC